jgi:alkanesulfonate monooxygenase SsuD/methylene tetrahydromethanopterin reductase-like flavin-dependent oxidoreductase (luciferase family)
VLAQQVATLDLLSGGRVIFGAGLGGVKSEFEKFGEPSDTKTRAAMLDEGLELLRRLWSGEEVSHRGEHYTVDGVTLAPTPLQGHLPIWIGGNSPAARRRAARWDGWMPDSAYSPEHAVSPADVSEGLSLGVSDVAVIGEGNPEPYAEAGATWWLENVHDRRGSPEEMLRLVASGPSSRSP